MDVVLQILNGIFALLWRELAIEVLVDDCHLCRAVRLVRHTPYTPCSRLHTGRVPPTHRESAAQSVGRDTVHRTLLLVVGGWAVGGERQWRGKVVVDKGEKGRGKPWKGRQRRILERNYGGASFEAMDRCSPAKLLAVQCHYSAWVTRRWRRNVRGSWVSNRWARGVLRVHPTPPLDPLWVGCGLGAPDK
jgi:hypothetical protein